MLVPRWMASELWGDACRVLAVSTHTHENPLTSMTGVGDQKNATSEAAKLERVVVVDHGRHTLDTR